MVGNEKRNSETMVRTGTVSGVIFVKGILAIGEWKWGLWKVFGFGAIFVLLEIFVMNNMNTECVCCT